jgi:hypothetical protein
VCVAGHKLSTPLGRLSCEVIKCIQTFDSVVVVVVVVVVIRRVPEEGHVIWIILAGRHLRRGIDVSILVVLEWNGVCWCVGVNWTGLQRSKFRYFAVCGSDEL